jgi:hypothetical protein
VYGGNHDEMTGSISNDWSPSKPESESESYITTDGQSASLSWIKASIWGLRPDFYLSDSFVFVDVGRSL